MVNCACIVSFNRLEIDVCLKTSSSKLTILFFETKLEETMSFKLLIYTIYYTFINIF